MAKLYRVIPDYIASKMVTISREYYQEEGFEEYVDISEDLFYKLGYISAHDHMHKYFRVSMDSYSWYAGKEDGIYFFLNPIDGLYNFIDFTDWHEDSIAKIVEYEIPDSIVDSFLHGYGSYGWAERISEEVKIPLSYLAKDSVVQEKLDSDLKRDLMKILIDDSNEMIEVIKKLIMNDYFGKRTMTNWKNWLLRNKDNGNVEKYFSKIVEDAKIKRLENCGMFFKSDIITGKSMIITIEDREMFLEFLSNPSEYIEKFNEFCERSNGIFSAESVLQRYNDREKLIKVLKR